MTGLIFPHNKLIMKKAGSVAPQPLGLSASLATHTGINNSWVQRTFDLSIYAGHTIRLVWSWEIDTNWESVYRSDVQLDTIAFDSNSYGFESGVDGFTTMRAGGGRAYDSRSWVAVKSRDNGDYWCRTSGETTTLYTGALGAQSGSYFIYAETSSPVRYGDVMWVRSPQIVCSGNPGNCTFYEGRDLDGPDGNNDSFMDFYIDVDAQP